MGSISSPGVGGDGGLELHQVLAGDAGELLQPQSGAGPVVEIEAVGGPAHVVVGGGPEELPDVRLRQTLLPGNEGGIEQGAVDVPPAMDLAVIQGVLPEGLIGLQQQGIEGPCRQPVQQGLVLPPLSGTKQVQDLVLFRHGGSLLSGGIT